MNKITLSPMVKSLLYLVLKLFVIGLVSLKV